MYSLYKRILSSSNAIIDAITDSFSFISTLYEEWLKELFSTYMFIYTYTMVMFLCT